MNTRSFLAAILKAGVSAAILPPALTYARSWKAPNSRIWSVSYDLGSGDQTTYGIIQTISPAELEQLFQPKAERLNQLLNYLNYLNKADKNLSSSVIYALSH